MDYSLIKPQDDLPCKQTQGISSEKTLLQNTGNTNNSSIIVQSEKTYIACNMAEHLEEEKTEGPKEIKEQIEKKSSSSGISMKRDDL